MRPLEAFAAASVAVDDVLLTLGITHRQLRDLAIEIVACRIGTAGVEAATAPAMVAGILEELARQRLGEVESNLNAAARRFYGAPPLKTKGAS